MDLYRNVASQFIEENPEFSIEVQSLAGSYQEKLYSALAAGTGPNMIKMATLARMHLMREEDLLLEFPEDIFPPSWFEEAYPLFDTKTNGRYVLPTGTTCTLLMYNKEMFAEAGLDPESPPRTWDDFVAAAKATTTRDSNGTITQAGITVTDEFPVLNQIYQLGGNVIQNNGAEQISLMTSSEVHEAFRYITDLALVHDVWDRGFPGNYEAMGTGPDRHDRGADVGHWRVCQHLRRYVSQHRLRSAAHPDRRTRSSVWLQGHRDLDRSRNRPPRKLCADLGVYGVPLQGRGQRILLGAVRPDFARAGTGGPDERPQADGIARPEQSGRNQSAGNATIPRPPSARRLS